MHVTLTTGCSQIMFTKFAKFSGHIYKLGQKSWATFAFLERFPIHIGPTPPPDHPTNNVGRVYPEFFSEFQLCIGCGGGGRTARKFRKGFTVLKGNREMTEKYEHCSTVLRTFVQDLNGFEVMQLIF